MSARAPSWMRRFLLELLRVVGIALLASGIVLLLLAWGVWGVTHP